MLIDDYFLKDTIKSCYDKHDFIKQCWYYYFRTHKDHLASLLYLSLSKQLKLELADYYDRIHQSIHGTNTVPPIAVEPVSEEKS